MQCERFIPLWRCASISEASLSRGWLYRFFFRRQEMFTIMAASTATKAVCPTKGVRRIGFQFHRVVTAQEEPKTSFTVTSKRIFKYLGRLINSFSHFFNSSASIFVVNPHFGHTTSGFFSRSETLICVALPQAWHLIGNSASPKRSDSIFPKHSTLGKAHRIGPPGSCCSCTLKFDYTLDVHAS
jgi:hypothetical protein